jgi:putative CocE/NonD family hydrolase
VTPVVRPCERDGKPAVLAGRRPSRLLVAVAAIAMTIGLGQVHSAQITSPFTYREVMVPMRDGIRLQTVILTPIGRSGPLPILLLRTPYGVPDRAPQQVPIEYRSLARDGYIFVFQSVRGRFKSEGRFGVSTLVDMSIPHAVNDATDAYDTINWLVNNVPDNNGRVGMFGVSYAGLTAGLALLDPPAALKAVSEQGADADEWMNDDFHRYGALRLSYAFEYSVLEQAKENANSPFHFGTYDTYEWYLDLGPLSAVNSRYLHGGLSFWNDIVRHPNYDAYWKKDAWVRRLHGTAVPILNVSGYWDQEDPWGPWQIFKHAAQRGSGGLDFMVAGPWTHGEWARQPRGRGIGIVPLGGHETAREFRDDIEAPFFRYYLHGIGAKPDWRVKSFQTGSNTWRTYETWPPQNSTPANLYLHSNGTLSFHRPGDSPDHDPYREYVSDPSDPVPYRPRPISPTGPGGDWATWEVGDQRFVDHRPDVLSYVSAPLEHDIVVTGTLSAVLYASTSGTDSDFIVKLIDVYPQDAQKDPWGAGGPAPGQYAKSLNGYELPIAMEIRRGRYLRSFEHPAPLTPNIPAKWNIPLHDHDHVFRKGHRIMVQIQSTWFPVIDRNPQKFVGSIYAAKPSDFVEATQRIFSTRALPSRIVLPIVRQREIARTLR